MKRTSLYLTLIAALLAIGCAKPEENTLSPEDSHYLKSFSMGIESMATKASINFTSGAISWTDDDHVLVYVPETGKSGQYKYQGGVFVPVDPEHPLEIGDGMAYAYYPADAYSISAGTVTLTMPASVVADPGNKLPMGGIILVK